MNFVKGSLVLDQTHSERDQEGHDKYREINLQEEQYACQSPITTVSKLTFLSHSGKHVKRFKIIMADHVKV